MSKTKTPKNSKKAFPFLQYLKVNKKEGLIFLIAYIIIAIVIRYCYPFADITTDSGGYANWSWHNAGKPFEYGNPRPQGYSNFLSALTEVTVGDGIVFFAQYFLHCIAVYLFYNTINYFISFSRPVKLCFLATTILFVPAIYMTNMVMSDSLFTSLTIIFISLCIWMLHQPNYTLLATTILIMFWAITVRYIGFTFPVILIAALFVSYKQKLIALISSFVICALLFAYVQNIKNGTEADMGIDVFSAFSGWQKANNALHVVPHLDHNQPLVSTDDPTMLLIDSFVRVTYPYYDTIYADENSVTYKHIWQKNSVLHFTLNRLARNLGHKQYHVAWTHTSEELSNYGDLLIQQHFGKFFIYYLMNNAKRSLHPPAEVLDKFAERIYAPVIQRYFNWHENEDIQPRNDIARPILKATPTIYSFYWFLFFAGAIYLSILVVRKKLKAAHKKIALLLIGSVILYIAASIYAAPVNLRFLLPIRMMMLGTVFIAIHQIVNSKHRNA